MKPSMAGSNPGYGRFSNDTHGTETMSFLINDSEELIDISMHRCEGSDLLKSYLKLLESVS